MLNKVEIARYLVMGFQGLKSLFNQNGGSRAVSSGVQRVNLRIANIGAGQNSAEALNIL